MDGVPLTIDFGVMDITTCTPLENALVDICELDILMFFPLRVLINGIPGHCNVCSLSATSFNCLLN